MAPGLLLLQMDRALGMHANGVEEATPLLEVWTWHTDRQAAPSYLVAAVTR